MLKIEYVCNNQGSGNAECLHNSSLQQLCEQVPLKTTAKNEAFSFGLALKIFSLNCCLYLCLYSSFCNAYQNGPVCMSCPLTLKLKELHELKRFRVVMQYLYRIKLESDRLVSIRNDLKTELILSVT